MPHLQPLINLLQRFSSDPRRKVFRLWKLRPRELRTVMHIADFEADMWQRNMRLGESSLAHHLALMQLLQDVIVQPRQSTSDASRSPPAA